MKHINSTAFCIYIYLTMYAGFDSRNSHYKLIDLKAKDIARLTGVSTKTIQNYLKELQKIKAIDFTTDGYITISNYETLFIKTKETFPKDEDSLLLLGEYFSFNSKYTSHDSKQNSVSEKNPSVESAKNTNQSNKSNTYTVSSNKVSKLDNIQPNRNRWDNSQGVWMKLDDLGSIDELVKDFNDEMEKNKF